MQMLGGQRAVLCSLSPAQCNLQAIHFIRAIVPPNTWKGKSIIARDY